MATSVGGPIEALLRDRLAKSIVPLVHLEIVNESNKHSVAPGSETHFKVGPSPMRYARRKKPHPLPRAAPQWQVLVVSPAFEGVAIIDRHRQVNDAVRGGAAEFPVQ